MKEEQKELYLPIGERIKEKREECGYTQEKLASLIDVSTQYLSTLERGQVGTKISTMIHICDVLQVSCDYIMMGREDPNDISGVLKRLEYLSPEQLEIVERGINILLEAMETPASEQ